MTHHTYEQTICVTGASGTVGRALVRRLQTANLPFRAAYTSAERASAARAEGIDAVVADYRDPATVRAAFAGCERVFLLGPNTPDQTELELAAVQAAIAAGVRHVAKPSVMGAAHEDFSLALVHRPTERALEASGLAWTHLRPNSFMQNVETFMAPSIRAEGMFFSATDNARISHVDVRDIADVAFAALTEDGHAGRAYLLTGPEAVRYDDVAHLLAAALGRDVHHVALPPADLRHGMLAEGMPESIADRMLDLERYFREGRAERVTDDVARVSGHAPRRFVDYVREAAPRLGARARVTDAASAAP
jgi:uncharacterized protein YbjT (DUF2867 family)